MSADAAVALRMTLCSWSIAQTRDSYGASDSAASYGDATVAVVVAAAVVARFAHQYVEMRMGLV